MFIDWCCHLCMQNHLWTASRLWEKATGKSRWKSSKRNRRKGRRSWRNRRALEGAKSAARQACSMQLNREGEARQGRQWEREGLEWREVRGSEPREEERPPSEAGPTREGGPATCLGAEGLVWAGGRESPFVGLRRAMGGRVKTFSIRGDDSGLGSLQSAVLYSTVRAEQPVGVLELLVY